MIADDVCGQFLATVLGHLRLVLVSRRDEALVWLVAKELCVFERPLRSSVIGSRVCVPDLVPACLSLRLL